MAIQTINLGTYANDGTGDDLRVAFQKVNANILELASTVYGANVGAVPPISGVEQGELWWSTVEGRLYVYYNGAWIDASPEDGFVTYDVTAETATGGASVRLNGTDLSQDSIKFASSTNVTVTRTDTNTITISSESYTGNVTGNLLGNVQGNVTGNVVGNTNGTHNGAVIGNVTGDVLGDTNGLHTGPVIGNVTGNVTGDTTGTHTGPVIGDVTGDTTGTHTGAVVGNLTGDTTGTHTGPVIGDVTGDTTGTHTGAVVGNVTGNLTGDTTGTHTGAVVGNVTGNTTGTHTGAVVGNLTGDTTGTHTGAVIGDVTGDIYDGAVKIFDNQTRETKIDIVTDTGSIVLAHNSVNLYNNSGTLLIFGDSSEFIGSLTGNASTVTNGVYTSSSITALADVDTVSVTPTNGQTLVWDSGVSQWKPGTIAAGGVTKIIAGTNISISPTNGLGDVTINSTGGGTGGSLDFGSFTAPSGFTLDMGTF